MNLFSNIQFIVLLGLIQPWLLQIPIQKKILAEGWSAFEKGNFSDAKSLNDSCLQTSRAARDFSTFANCLINNGTIAYVEGDFQAALTWYDSSYRVYLALSDTIQMGNALRNMAIASRRLSRYGPGIIFCNQALLLLKSPKHNELKAQVLNTLATLFETTNNLEYAKHTLQQALRLTQKTKNSHFYTNLGNIFFKINKIDSAIFFYDQALLIETNLVERALILNNLGESFIQLDSGLRARRALEESMMIRRAKDTLALVSSFNNFARLALNEKNFREAHRYLLLAERHLHKVPNERESLKFLGLLKKYFQQTNRFEKALKVDAQYDSLSRKIFENERLQVSELQTAFALKERDEQLKLQEQTLKLHRAELQQKTFFNQVITAGIAVLLLITVLFFYLYRVNSVLRYKNEMLIHEQHHRVKNNLQMISSLLSVQSSWHSDAKVKNVLSENENRIQSIALLHRMLYQRDVSSTVSVLPYVRELAYELKYALGASHTVFDVSIELDQLPIEKTICLGLILNELITNSVKYASPIDQLKISISILNKKNQAELRYADNGSGFLPDSFLKSDRFGSRLITIQVKQLKGKYTIANTGGFYFVLSFPISYA